jgi:pyrrolysine biosynthesis protein PylD
VHKGFKVYGYDADKVALEKAISTLGITPLDLSSPRKFSMIFEATPCANTIPEALLSEGCVISTPGIPCAISNDIRKEYNVELVMEPLGIGTASMLYSVINTNSSSVEARLEDVWSQSSCGSTVRRPFRCAQED